MSTIYTPDIGREFYVTYGRAMAAWAGLESALCSLFVRLTDTRLALGTAVFYSAKSFRGKAEMIGACVEHVRMVPAGKHFLEKVVGVASTYSQTRNSLAHDEHAWEVHEGESAFVEITIKRVTNGEQLTETEIGYADTNFTHLALVVLVSLGGRSRTLLRAPELCLSLLDLLPSEAAHKPLEHLVLNGRLQEIVRS
jgi:hypothetical protein